MAGRTTARQSRRGLAVGVGGGETGCSAMSASSTERWRVVRHSEPVDGADANPYRGAEALRERLGCHPQALRLSGVRGQPAASSAFGCDSSTSAVPDSTTMSPPWASPRKFKLTFGLWPMLRIRALGWLYTETFSPPSHGNPTGRGSGASDGRHRRQPHTVSSRRCRATRSPNSVLSSRPGDRPPAKTCRSHEDTARARTLVSAHRTADPRKSPSQTATATEESRLSLPRTTGHVVPHGAAIRASAPARRIARASAP